MKINLRFILILPLLAVLATNAAFWEFIYGPQVDQEPEGIKLYTYLLFALSVASIVFYGRYMEPLIRKWMYVVLACIGGLMLESYADQGSWMSYPHVFSKLFVLLIMFGVYAFHRRFGLPSLSQLIGALVFVLLANLLVFHRDSLSLSAFAENERGFGSAAAYLFVPVTLYCLNRYLTHGNILMLLSFFVCLPLIIFLQHRSVWIATAIAVPLDLLLLLRTPGAKFSFTKVVMLVALPAILGSLGVTMVVLNNPEVVTRMQTNVEDMANADKQGTGSWRLKQLESYIPYVQDRPVAGWRLEGFELPMQFYDPSNDQPMWPDHTGHHFHNFYLDRAFYFGVLGILMVVLIPIIRVVQRLFQRGPMRADTALLIAYFGCLLVFGTSYDWSTYHFGLLGLLLAAVAEPEPQAEPLPAYEAPKWAAEPATLVAS
ncbi:O-antigen ligase family protein [Hymenobacter setariae]|uniref:O-antigen ligase family protein n=1 Tax=Hymenobacter setariae TaxID=2594794 RepID=A0A558BMU6_9BACT|nr:O-antigen ligase family protein [Hymenobacter setariae]TVT37832.1 O-antigen ligase family protein [Hymenobacter setariae]